METPDSDHGRCEGVHLPTDDALESVDHLSPHFEGIYTEVRHGSRPSLPDNPDIEAVHGSHDGPCLNSYRSFRAAWP